MLTRPACYELQVLRVYTRVHGGRGLASPFLSKRPGNEARRGYAYTRIKFILVLCTYLAHNTRMGT